MCSQQGFATLRRKIRACQDAGLMEPPSTDTTHRFRVVAADYLVPTLRDLVRMLCAEGFSAHLLMGLDEDPPYVGILVDAPKTTLSFWPAHDSPSVHVTMDCAAEAHIKHTQMVSYRTLLDGEVPTLLEPRISRALCWQPPII